VRKRKRERERRKDIVGVRVFAKLHTSKQTHFDYQKVHESPENFQIWGGYI